MINRRLFTGLVLVSSLLFLVRTTLQTSTSNARVDNTTVTTLDATLSSTPPFLPVFSQTERVSYLPLSVLILVGVVSIVAYRTQDAAMSHAANQSYGIVPQPPAHPPLFNDLSPIASNGHTGALVESHRQATDTNAIDSAAAAMTTQTVPTDNRVMTEPFPAKMRTFRRAIEQSPASVIITDSKARIEFVNPQFEEVTGYSSAEAIGRSPRILKSGVHPPDFYGSMWRTLLDGKVWRGEICNRRRSGELFWEDTSITAVFDDDGKVANYVAVKIDITERKQIEEQLAAHVDSLEKAKRELEEISEHEKATSESLQARLKELEAFNRIAIGHEMQIIALKKEINEMCADTGDPPKYEIAKSKTVT